VSTRTGSRLHPRAAAGHVGQVACRGILEAKTELDDVLLLRGEVQHIGPNEVAMFKPRWGAFFGTPLDAHLQALAIDTLVFTGCNFPNCPRTSIYEASERDYRIVLVQDAVSGLYEIGEEEMRNIGVTVLSAAEVVRAATF
jgi:nicotinamidase-related amidase